ncbi:MAG: hypothetical protein CVV30_05000 [Methanomicrobiales archaeon HGW-Methanomicrobiales-1]|nr:MAG: hypothetical protein CVV30_05000 [Methanomicrobiales archaeon HGW-Methanomicrobiales-1]
MKIISDYVQEIAENQKDQCKCTNNSPSRQENLQKIDSLILTTGFRDGIGIRLFNGITTWFHDCLLERTPYLFSVRTDFFNI